MASSVVAAGAREAQNPAVRPSFRATISPARPRRLALLGEGPRPLAVVLGGQHARDALGPIAGDGLVHGQAEALTRRLLGELDEQRRALEDLARPALGRLHQLPVRYDFVD